MKILFYLYRYPGWGGVETVTSIISSELIKCGHEIVIISETWQDNSQSLISGQKIIHLPNSLEEIDKNIAFVDWLVKENKFDFIIYQDCYVPNEKIPIKVANSNKIPLIVFEHNTPTRFNNIRYIDNPYSCKGIIKSIFYPYFRKRYIKWDIERKKRLYDSCSKYIMLSKCYVTEIEQLLKINTPNNKFVALYNPCPYSISSFDWVRDDDCNKIDEVISVGRIEKNKGIDKLLKIWEKVERYCPTYKLTIVGDGSEKDNLIRLSQRLGLQRISFEGFKNPLPYYERAKFFLMASKFEGWPMSIIEAMTYGCVPIVENNFSALSEMIENGINGVIVPKRANAKYWSEIIVYLINNSTQRRKMAFNGINFVEAFNAERIAIQWIELLEQIKKS